MSESKALLERLSKVAKTYVGVRELDSLGKESRLVRFFRLATDGKAEGEPWCMAFVQCCVQIVEAENFLCSNLFRSESCMSVWNNTPKPLRREEPQTGHIVIFQRKDKPYLGHCGIVMDRLTSEKFLTVEGNTTNGNGIEREGDGVFLKERRYEGTGIFRIAGFLAPF